LREQLLIGIVPRVSHTIGDHGREQRFNRTECGNGEGRSHQIANQFERDVRKMETRQTNGNAAESCADRCDRPTGDMRGDAR